MVATVCCVLNNSLLCFYNSLVKTFLLQHWMVLYLENMHFLYEHHKQMNILCVSTKLKISRKFLK